MGLVSHLSNRCSVLFRAKPFLKRISGCDIFTRTLCLSPSTLYNDPKKKKILFFGTDSFSLETLKVLHQNL